MYHPWHADIRLMSAMADIQGLDIGAASEVKISYLV